MKTLFLGLTILITQFGFTQTTTIVNQKTFGGDLDDLIADIILLNNGTYIISGGSKSGITGNKTTVNYGMYDGWLINVNSDFSVNWQLNLGGTDNDFVSKLIATNDGGFMIVSTSSSPISGNKTAPNKGGSDIWVLKLDNLGNIDWQNTYGGSGDDQISSIEVLNDGTYILSGDSDSPISGDKTENSRGGKDFWVLKISSTGNIIWDKTIGGDADDISIDINIDNNQNVFIVGDSKSSLSGEKSENNYGYQNIWLLKLDSAGNIIWDKTIGGSSLEQNTHITIFSDKIFVSCASDSPISGTKTSINNGLTDFWLTCLDTNANILWDKTYGGSTASSGTASQTLSKIFKITENRFIMTGSSNCDISGTKTEPNVGNQDMWLVMVDSLGQEIWQKTIGGSLFDALNKIYEISNNHYVLAGTSWSDIGGDKTENAYGFTDIWLLELTTNLGLENLTETTAVSLYPNPSNGQFTLNGLQKNSNISIFNLQGKLVKQVITQQNNLNINLADVEKGVYVINIKNNTTHKTIKLVVE